MWGLTFFCLIFFSISCRRRSLNKVCSCFSETLVYEWSKISECCCYCHCCCFCCWGWGFFWNYVLKYSCIQPLSCSFSKKSISQVFEQSLFLFSFSFLLLNGPFLNPLGWWDASNPRVSFLLQRERQRRGGKMTLLLLPLLMSTPFKVVQQHPWWQEM